MCKILREVDHHLSRLKQHEVDHQSRERKQKEERPEWPTEEEAERNKRTIGTALGLVVLQIGVMGYTIGKITERVIKRWRSQ